MKFKKTLLSTLLLSALIITTANSQIPDKFTNLLCSNNSTVESEKAAAPTFDTKGHLTKRSQKILPVLIKEDGTVTKLKHEDLIKKIGDYEYVNLDKINELIMQPQGLTMYYKADSKGEFFEYRKNPDEPFQKKFNLNNKFLLDSPKERKMDIKTIKDKRYVRFTDFISSHAPIADYILYDYQNNILNIYEKEQTEAFPSDNKTGVLHGQISPSSLVNFKEGDNTQSLSQRKTLTRKEISSAISFADANWKIPKGMKTCYPNPASTKEVRAWLETLDSSDDKIKTLTRAGIDNVYIYINKKTKAVKLIPRDMNINLADLTRMGNTVDMPQLIGENIEFQDQGNTINYKLKEDFTPVGSLKDQNYKGLLQTVGVTSTGVELDQMTNKAKDEFRYNWDDKIYNDAYGTRGLYDIPAYKAKTPIPQKITGLHSTGKGNMYSEIALSMSVYNIFNVKVDGKGLYDTYSVVLDNGYVLTAGQLEAQFSNGYRREVKNLDLDIQGRTIKQVINYYAQNGPNQVVALISDVNIPIPYADQVYR